MVRSIINTLVTLIALSTIGCAANTGSDLSSENSGPQMDSSAIQIDANGMSCTQVRDNVTGRPQQVCCHDQGEIIDTNATSACGETVIAGCITATNTCTVYSNNTQTVVQCPSSMSCEECMAGGINAPAAAACH